MAEYPFHVRAIDEASGVTVRQLPIPFQTFKEAELAAKRETLREGFEHVVCVSLDPKDPRNPKGDANKHRQGYAVYDPETHADLVGEAPAKKKK